MCGDRSLCQFSCVVVLSCVPFITFLVIRIVKGQDDVNSSTIDRPNMEHYPNTRYMTAKKDWQRGLYFESMLGCITNILPTLPWLLSLICPRFQTVAVAAHVLWRYEDTPCHDVTAHVPCLRHGTARDGSFFSTSAYQLPPNTAQILYYSIGCLASQYSHIGILKFY